MRYLTEDLIESVKVRTKAPPNISDATILRFLNEQMMLRMLPLIMGVREDFFLDFKRVPVSAGVSRYTLPERASGEALKDVWWVDSNGNRKRTLARSTVHTIDTSTITGDPNTFILAGDEMIVFPTPDQASGYLEMWFFHRPGELVDTADCTKITGVSSAGGTTTFTVDTDLTASLSVGDTVDFLSGKSPYLLWSYDVAITAITATTIEVATADVEGEGGSVEPIVGDYICASRTANIPMIPSEFHPVLCQQASLPILESIGDLNKLQVAKATCDEMERSALKLISNRVESLPEVINNNAGVLSSMGNSGIVGFGI